MTEATPITEQLAALKEELALAQAISGPSEPACLYLANPPASLVIQTYRQQRSSEAAQNNALPVFYAEIPPLFPDRPALIDVLSAALSIQRKRKNQILSEEWLAEQLRVQLVEFAILADAHHLTTRANAVEWLVMYFRRYLPHVPLVLMGEGKQMDDLLLWNATAWVVRRFNRIRLPGEPEARESLSSRADGEGLLWMKDSEFTQDK